MPFLSDDSHAFFADSGAAPSRSVRERRRPGRREHLEERIRSEFLEMPGLILSLPQAQRLFGLRVDICERILVRLVATGFLVPRRSGHYGRPLHR